MQYSNLRRVLLSTTGVALALGVTEARAQDVLETVVVTAEKQATDIQKTGLSITAIQPDNVSAEGQARLTDILQNVPAVQVYRGAVNNGAYFIRGIGTTQGTNSTLELVDGIYVNWYTAEALSSTDASRIEVLRGPQGTLYGRGAFGGVINVITNDPSDKYEGKIFVEGGAYNEVKSTAVVNIPLDSDMALRVVAFSDQQTGYMHPDGRAGTDVQGFRAKLQYKPSEDFDIKLVGSFINSIQSGSADTLPVNERAANFSSPAFGGFNPCGGDPHPNKYDAWHSPPKYYAAFACTVPAQLPVNPSPVTGVCQGVSRQDNAVSDVGVNMDYDFGWSAFTLLANMDQQKYPLGEFQSNPFLGTVPGQDNYSNIFYNSVEARLSSEASDSLKWLAGVYWDEQLYHAHSWNRATGVTAAVPLGSDRLTNQNGGSYAGFGQVTVPVVDNFRVIAGVRYSDDHNTQQLYSLNVATNVPTGTKSDVSFDKSRLTYKAGAEFDLSPENMLYANTATGYRPIVFATDAYCVGKTSGHRYLPADGTGAVVPQPAGLCTTANATASTVGGTNGEGTQLTSVSVVVPSDTVTTYEVGSKNRFLGNKLEANIDAYYYKFGGLGISSQSANHANQIAPFVSQQIGTKAWGSELELTWLMTDNDKVYVGLSYEITRTGVSPFNTPNCYNFGIKTHPNVEDSINTTNFALCNAKNLAANPISVNWVRFRPAVSSSAPLFNAPTWNGNVGYQHIFDLSSGATVTAAVNVHFESSKNTAASLYYDAVNPAFHTTDFNLTYNTSDGKWQVAAWVKNIENHPIVLGAQGNIAAAATDYLYPTLAPPRMWGVNLTAKF
jgi:iron complex outermembrane receptor protein